MRQAWPAHPEVPISKAVRAGDFVFTSAYGPWTFDPALVTCRAAGVGCDSDFQCCPGTLCCFSGVSLDTRCTDVSGSGWVCPGDTPIPEGGCAAGLVFVPAVPETPKAVESHGSGE